jgi:predicted DNA-binding transcriptional regulator AlpA
MTELHDDVVLTEAEFRRLAGNMSRSTVRRLDQRGEAPPKVQLSDRRVGRRLGAVRAWLHQRTLIKKVEPNACGGAGPKESYYNDDPPNKLLDSR